MKKTKYTALVFQAIFEIVRYEAALRLRGNGAILQQVTRQSASAKPAGCAMCGATVTQNNSAAPAPTAPEARK